MAIAGGHFLGPLIAGHVIERAPPWTPGSGGAMTFLAGAVPLAVLALAAAFTACSTPGSDADHRTPVERRVAVRDLVRLHGMPEALYVGIVALTSVDLLVAYLPVLDEERGIRPSVIGYLLATRGAMSIVSRLTIGPALRRLGRRGLVMTAMAISAVTVAGIAFPVPVWLLFIQVAVAGFSIGVCMPMTVAWVASRAPEGARGIALGLRLTGNRLRSPCPWSWAVRRRRLAPARSSSRLARRSAWGGISCDMRRWTKGRRRQLHSADSPTAGRIA